MGASAQKLSGDLSPLRGQTEVNIVLDFSGTLVNGRTEQKYINEETKGKKAADKEKWLKEWNENLRSNAYSMLIRDFNKTIDKKLFVVDDIPDAEYTIYVKIKEIKTGYFAGVVAKPSELKAKVYFFRTGEDTPFATAEYKKSRSKLSANIPYFVTRIAMSFGTLGSNIGKTVNKNLKK